MICIDTNVLLRYLLRDDEAQAVRADSVVNGDETVLIPDVVLVEAVWTLAGSKYRLGKSDIVATIESLFGEPNVRFENDQVVWSALRAFRNAAPVRVGKRNREADFADALIVYKALHTASAANDTLRAVYTFDVAARQLPHTEPP